MSPEQADALIFDASATINLLGTGMAGRIVRLLDHPVTMADRTFREIRRHPINGCDHAGELDELARGGHLRIETLNKDANSLFFDLIADDLDGGLDDGEAAAIALAVSTGPSTAVITDDRKARNLLARRWPMQRIHCSIDILAVQKIEASLTRPILADAIYSALKNARMRVPVAKRAWVTDLIGAVRAADCPSLGSMT
jgi:predicted nucleic acid-binding protein